MTACPGSEGLLFLEDAYTPGMREPLQALRCLFLRKLNECCGHPALRYRAVLPYSLQMSSPVLLFTLVARTPLR